MCSAVTDAVRSSISTACLRRTPRQRCCRLAARADFDVVTLANDPPGATMGAEELSLQWTGGAFASFLAADRANRVVLLRIALNHDIGRLRTKTPGNH